MESTTIIPNVAGHWSHYPLAASLRTMTSRPTALINDARAFARAELELGAGQGRPDAVFLTMGTGIGGAIALGGTILRGPGDRSGEVGHVMVDPNGLRCNCGSRGCLETVAGGRALMSAWSATQGADAKPATPEDVVNAARSGDDHAQLILDAAGTAIGIALGSTLALLGLNTVIVGGGVAPAFDLMRPAVRRALEARSALLGPIEFVPARLGTEAGAIGAALHAMAPE
jgi:glucokinase